MRAEIIAAHSKLRVLSRDRLIATALAGFIAPPEKQEAIGAKVHELAKQHEVTFHEMLSIQWVATSIRAGVLPEGGSEAE